MMSVVARAGALKIATAAATASGKNLDVNLTMDSPLKAALVRRT